MKYNMMEEEGISKKGGVNIQLVIILVLAVLLVIFTLQNQEKVSINLFFWTIHQIPVALLIILCLLLGYLIHFMWLIPRIWKLKSDLSRSRQENDELQETVHQSVRGRAKPDPEGIALDDEDGPNDVDLARKNVSRRFFKE